MWYYQNDTLNVSFNCSSNQEVCIVDLMQRVDAVCSFRVEDFPDPFQNCSTSCQTSMDGQVDVCANISQLRNMTLFTTFEGKNPNCTESDYIPFSKVISSRCLFIIGK